MPAAKHQGIRVVVYVMVPGFISHAPIKADVHVCFRTIVPAPTQNRDVVMAG